MDERRGEYALLEPGAYELLQGYGLPLPRYAFVSSEQDARDAALRIGFPVVMKVVSPDIIHKSDVGGVKLGLRSVAEVDEAYSTFLRMGEKRQADIAGVLIVEQAPSGQEVIVGGFRDAEFGPVVMFGMGGILVEVMKDVSFGLSPVTPEEARQMVQGTLAGRLLAGVRGRPPGDIDAVCNVIVAASKLLSDHKEIEEIDLNPVTVYETGCVILDARVIMRA
jgi:acetyl-CoA synthetase (ADP-forming)